MRNARIAFGDRVVADDLTLEFAAGLTTCLLGRSGVGKTSLLRWLAGLLPGTAREQAVAYMAQSDLLLPWLSVLDNVLLGYRLRGDATALKAAGPRARDLLGEVGLLDRLDDLPHVLSGGMRQRAALARTLCEDRSVVLMDEPFAHLDAVTRLELQDLSGAASRRPHCRAGDPRSARSAARRSSDPRAVGLAFLRRTGDRAAGCGAARPGRSGVARAAGASLRRASGARPMRPLITAIGLLMGWEGLVWATGVPVYILPPPSRVALVLVERFDLLLGEAAWTAAEMVMGLALGLILGAALAIVFAASMGWRRWALPLVIVSQAIPVIAIAPLLVLWLGYGMASKVAMAALVIFFPVVSALYDGLRRTDQGWLDLARTMDASPRATLLQIRLPAALPAFASGARIAAAVAPIGAVIGEWVGASAGLGHLMTQSLARGQTPLAFAALFVLCLLGLALYHATDRLARLLVPWQLPQGE